MVNSFPALPPSLHHFCAHTNLCSTVRSIISGILQQHPSAVAADGVSKVNPIFWYTPHSPICRQHVIAIHHTILFQDGFADSRRRRPLPFDLHILSSSPKSLSEDRRIICNLTAVNVLNSRSFRLLQVSCRVTSSDDTTVTAGILSSDVI